MKNKYTESGMICPQWTGDSAIKQFYDDMSPSYKEGTVLGRMNINEQFSPENCCWVPSNARNVVSTRARTLNVDGEEMTMSQWTLAMGYSKNRISDRLRMGWNERDAVLGRPGDHTTHNAIYFVDENGFPIAQDDPRFL